jgi:hypothetical protein
VKSFCLLQTAVEVWLIRNSSLLLIFETDALAQEFAAHARSAVKLSPRRDVNSPLSRIDGPDAYRRLWHKQKISTFQYVLALNQFASRSFALLPQYPVFPWLFERDLGRPIAPVLSACAANTLLRRIEPHTAIAAMLDAGDDVWDVDPDITAPRSELIPEVFAFPEVFNNVNGTEIQEDAVLPRGTTSFPQFCGRLRRKLDSISDIPKWIDVVFGSEHTVESSDMTVYLRTGGPPARLFTDAHPQRNSVMYPRIQKLWRAARVLSQPLLRFEIPTADFVFVFRKGVFEVYSPSERFAQLTRAAGVFECCAFSRDEVIFAGVVGVGTVWLYRSVTAESLVFAGNCELPDDLLDRMGPISSVAVSTHLGVVCELSQAYAVTFHLASGLFIRAIETETPCRWVMIADDAQLIVVIGYEDIEIFTINGTAVAAQTGIGPVHCCGMGGGEEPAVVIGSATEISFWVIDFDTMSLDRKKVIEFANPLAVLMFDHGSALLAVDRTGSARAFAAARPRKPLNRDQVGGCAMCGRQQRLWACRLCGLLYCSGCVSKQGDAVCLGCLSAVGDPEYTLSST